MTTNRENPADKDAANSALPEGMVVRARGCMLGQLTGDALGSMVEFKSAAEIRRLYPDGLHEIGPSPVHHTIAGQSTDDSEMALMLARTLVVDGQFDLERVAGAYADWLESGPFDQGRTITMAVEAMVAARGSGRSLAMAGRAAASRSSEANGALMRQSPLAIWGVHLEPGALDAIVRADTVLTHPNQVCQDASAAFIVALAATIREGLNAQAAYALACEWDRRHGASPTVTAALKAAAKRAPDYERNGGHVLNALQNAFYQALHASSFAAGVTATVMGGGDPDTNAAIAGALLGAIHGANAVPTQWRDAVLTCRPERGKPGVHRPRPEMLWPVDALTLADALLRHAPTTVPSSSVSDAADSPPSPTTLPSVGRGGAHVSATAVPAVVGVAVQPSGLPDQTRFRAALLGGAIGDALGRPAEATRTPCYAPPWPITDYIPWRGYRSGPRGTITDDTQHTMLVAECLLANGRLDPEDLGWRLVAWLPHGRGMGKATVAAVQRLREGVPWYLAGEESAGNGAAMRTAPIGLLRYADPGLLRSEAAISALPTHRDPMAVAGAVAMAAAVAWLLTRQPGAWSRGEFITAIQSAIKGLEPGPKSERRDPSSQTTLHDRIGELPDLRDQPPEQAFPDLWNGAFVLESVPAALYCFLRSPDDAERVLLQAANAAYDADTVAALAGTLVGALGGVTALPARLLPELEYRDELVALADGLYELATHRG